VALAAVRMGREWRMMVIMVMMMAAVRVAVVFLREPPLPNLDHEFYAAANESMSRQ